MRSPRGPLRFSAPHPAGGTPARPTAEYPLPAFPGLLLAVLVLALVAGAGCEGAPGGAGTGPDTDGDGDLPPRARAASPPVSAHPPLLPDRPRETRLPPGAVHRHPLFLESGDFVHLVVDQKGVDVELYLLGPAGETEVWTDGFNGDRGEEHLYAVAATSGIHTLELRPWSPTSGGAYEVRLETVRPAGEDDRLRDQAARLVSRGAGRIPDERSSLRDPGDGDRGEKADDSGLSTAEAYRTAADLWRRAAEPHERALTLARLARTEAERGRMDPAAGHYRQAVDLLRSLRPRGDAGSSVEVAGRDLPPLLNELGDLLRRLGDMEQARTVLEEALDRAQGSGSQREEAVACNNLALVHRHSGRPWEALAQYRRALRLWESTGDRSGRAWALHNLGVLYQWLGKPAEARDALEEALRLQRELGDRQAEAAVRTALGGVALWSGEPEAARQDLETALRLRRGDELGEATTLDRLGTAWLRQGDPARAETHHRRALELLEGTDAAVSRAHVLSNLGLALARQGRQDEAWRTQQAAIQLFRELSAPTGTAWALLRRGEVERRRGNLEAATATLRESLETVESVRGGISGEDLRSHYLATQREPYEALVGVLMERHRREPGAGWDRRALEVAERSRARSLLDRLTGAPTLDREARRRLEHLDQAIRRADRRLRRDGSADSTGDGSSQGAARLRRLLQQREALRVELERAVGAAGPVTPRPLAEIEAQLLRDGRILLVYFLGDEESYAWRLDGSVLSSFRLPPRGEIEAGAHRLLQLVYSEAGDGLRRSPDGQLELTAAALGEALLEPLASTPGNPRRPGTEGAVDLVIAADGALQSLPFGLLTLPDGPHRGEPLLAAYRVVHAPSASVWTHLRRRDRERTTPPDLLAVVAAPVFGPDDPRAGSTAGPDLLDRGGDAPSLQRSVQELGLDGLPPLIHTRREAEAILRRVPPERSWAALGFDAQREALLEPHRLERFRYLHFATHALIHPEEPELSGVVLSRVAASGEPRDGFLQSLEIARLELSCELVVLSACRTAAGRRMWGEGVVGLPRSFLTAGATGVLVSAWNVDDEATAHLMERFYHHLLDDALPPAEALRRAQLALRADRRWSDPYYWAAFLLVGAEPDPRPLAEPLH